jgi:hypothetical protein
MSSSMLTTAEEYVFEGGFPTPQTVQRACDDADLMRAITAYRFSSRRCRRSASMRATWRLARG